MTRRQRFDFVINYFTGHFPEPETELQFRNPFELLVAVILSAQCTDKRINQVTPPLFEAYPDALAMSRATAEDIFPYIRSVSYPNNKAKHLAGMARMLTEQYHCEVPSDRSELEKLPGVGRKTANVIASVVYNQPAMAVDTHVYRVSHRIGLVDAKANSPLKVELGLIKYIPEALVSKAHHWLILHGRYICIARRPLCEKCPLRPACRYFEKTRGAGPSSGDTPITAHPGLENQID